MKLIRMGLVAATATCLLVSAVAQSPVGTWKGKMDMKLDSMDAKTRQMVETMLQKMVVNLTVKGDKTYSLAVAGVPQAEGPNSKDNGTWTLSGKTVTFKSAKKENKGPNGEKPQVLTLSADGKTMTMPIPTGPGGPGGGSIVFKKA